MSHGTHVTHGDLLTFSIHGWRGVPQNGGFAKIATLAAVLGRRILVGLSRIAHDRPASSTASVAANKDEIFSLAYV